MLSVTEGESKHVCAFLQPSSIPFLRSCFFLLPLLASLFLCLSFLFLLLCFLFRFFLFSCSWIEPEAGFLSRVLPATVDRAFCISVRDSALLFPFSIAVPFSLLAPERSSCFSGFLHGWLVSICEGVLRQNEEHSSDKTCWSLIDRHWFNLSSMQTQRYNYFFNVVFLIK